MLADGGAVVGRIFKVHAAPVGTPWMWTLLFGQHVNCESGVAERSGRQTMLYRIAPYP